MSDQQVFLQWRNSLLGNLNTLDPKVVRYIQDRKVRVGFLKLGAHVGAIWTPGRRIYLNSRYYSLASDPSHPDVLSILLHEVCHLRQGIFTALSVYGELEAWQLGIRVRRELSGKPYHPKLVELMTLPLELDRGILRRAQILMQDYASKSYRADLLPLFPWHEELKYRLHL